MPPQATKDWLSLLHEKAENETKLGEGNSTDDFSFNLDSIDETEWENGIKIGTTIWGLGLLAGMAGVSGGLLASLLGIAALVCWVILPLSIYKDAEYMGRVTDWGPMKRTSTAGATFSFFNSVFFLIYLSRRHQALSGKKDSADLAA